jgi:hypothetical protein
MIPIRIASIQLWTLCSPIRVGVYLARFAMNGKLPTLGENRTVEPA